MKHPFLLLLLPTLLGLTSVVACGGSSSQSNTPHDAGTADGSHPGHTDGGGPHPDSPTSQGDSHATTDAKGATKDAGDDRPSPGGDAAPDSSQDAGADAGERADATFAAGAPITAASKQWTWVPFPDAVCANGTATGIGVNLGAAGSRVLIYMEGGGACWDDLTCYTLQTASFITSGYGKTEFEGESADAAYLAMPGGFFDRTSATNPFKDYSYVYIPYCTGDIFAGDHVTTLGTTVTHFVGYRNVGAFLARIVPTFPSASRVILAGSSAGGFGAGLNWFRTQEAFGDIRVDLIDDSGTAMPDDIVMSSSSTSVAERAAWNLDATLPAGCTTCDSDLASLYGYYDGAFASHRGSLLSYTEDSVLPSFFGISTAQFTTGLDEDLGKYFKASDPLKSFVIGAAGHVLWFSPQLATSAHVTVEQFVTQMVTDEAAWKSEGP